MSIKPDCHHVTPGSRHSRLLHSAGVNLGGEQLPGPSPANRPPPRVRMAAISDYRRAWPSTALEWMVELPPASGGGLTMRVKDHPRPEAAAVVSAGEQVREAELQVLQALMWHHDVLEVDARRRPTAGVQDMFHGP